MDLSVFEMFSVGIGPSSSHTIGPMRAAYRFAEALRDEGLLPRVASLGVDLYGSLALTGKGHGTDRAVQLGLSGERPESVDPDAVEGLVAAIATSRRLRLLGGPETAFDPARDLVFRRRESLPAHPNGMAFTARDSGGSELVRRIYYSVGGGFVRADGESAAAGTPRPPGPHPFRTAAQLFECCAQTGLPVSEIVWRNEATWRPREAVAAGVRYLWETMEACVRRGCAQEGILPGGLGVKRRAAATFRRLTTSSDTSDPLRALDWVDCWALAVNEENAAGGRVVTAPTNGAAGIVPAVGHYYLRFSPRATPEGIVRYLLTAGALGMLYKWNASISGAEVGCQGEVGVACSMAAGALTEALGGTPMQVENAAEIGMEHNLGLTCDPVKGLVQVPCIERNAMGAVKAINAARLALGGDGTHRVSLDTVIATMRRTGADMNKRYKETSRGGLAVNVTEC